MNLSSEFMTHDIKYFIPGRKFPSISITGKSCALQCSHCNGYYLKHMVPAVTPVEFLKRANKIEQDGGRGFLLSGGCDSEGKMPLAPFFNAICNIKKNTNLMINAHPGIADIDALRLLESAGVDVISVDIPAKITVLRDVYGLDISGQQFAEFLKELVELEVQITPHVTLGLSNEGNEAPPEFLDEFDWSLLVVNSLIPTKGTAMESRTPLGPSEVGSFISSVKRRYPSAEIRLGCMRPRSYEYERAAIESGAKGIAIPSGKIRKEYPGTMFSQCCGIP